MSAASARHVRIDTEVKSFANLPDIKQLADSSLEVTMSLQDLAPENTKRAQSTAINIFKGFLASENTTVEFVRTTLLTDNNGSAFVKLLDRFAMHLAFAQGRGGEIRKQNTVMSYYRNVKNWLLEDFPQHRHAIDQQLLKMGRILERYCLKRNQGETVSKAPACTKEDLRSLVDGLYSDASSAKEYQDAALLSIMWYAFGRASDLAFVRKSNLSVASGNVLFIRLIRAKTSEEQGLSLFPDKKSFITCPLHAIGMALAMQAFPVESLLDLEHFKAIEGNTTPSMLDQTPLTEALLHCDDEDINRVSTSEATTKPPTTTPVKMQGYVNRVLKGARKRQAKVGVSIGLSSHSFRRGGAQHANANSSLSPQWIFDRGSWNMTATNKAFAYVFNTTNEDRKVSKVLSDWSAEETPTVPSLASFDSATRTKIRKLARLLFASSMALEDRSFTLDQQVADLFVASLIQHFPEVNQRYPMSPYTSRMRICLFSLQVEMPQLLAWSVELNQKASKVSGDEENAITREMELINHQNAVIAQLINENRTLFARVTELEKPTRNNEDDESATVATATVLSPPSTTTQPSPKPKKRSAPQPPVATWFEWYTKTPRLWEFCEERQYKSQSKQIVGFMKLFLPRGFQLDPSDQRYSDLVLQAGTLAQTNMNKFLHEKGIKRKSGSGLLKHLRMLHRDGALRELIEAYRARIATDMIRDPSPESTTTFL